MSAPIKRYDDDSCMACAGFTLDADGFFILYEDYLASHAYDEEKKRAAFEAYCPVVASKFTDGDYVSLRVAEMWRTWKVCAKSRAKAAGCK